MQKQKSQIDIGQILQVLAQFDEVKHHLLTAGVEIFRAVSKSVTLLLEQLHNLNEKGGLDVINSIKSALEHLLPWSAEEKAQEIVANKKGEILKSIIAVLNSEMKKVEDSDDEHDQMKYEVLASIRGVILRELKKHRAFKRARRAQNIDRPVRAPNRRTSSKKDEPKIRKVCIE